MGPVPLRGSAIDDLPTIGTGLENGLNDTIDDAIYTFQVEMDDLVLTKVGDVMDQREILLQSRNTGSTNWRNDLTKVWENQKKMQTAMNTLSTLSLATPIYQGLIDLQ